MIRRHFLIEGIVQGVGFRPFVHRQAQRLGLSGWARNTAAGLELELEGPAAALDGFENTLRTAPPPLAVVEAVRTEERTPAGETGFVIRPSAGGRPPPWFPPTWPPAPPAWRNCRTRRAGGTATPSSTAPTAGRGFPSSGGCPTTGLPPPWPGSPCAPTAPQNTGTSAAAATTPSPTAARCAGQRPSTWTPPAPSRRATPSPWPSRPWRRGGLWR